jgi:hypothetical protein
MIDIRKNLYPCWTTTQFAKVLQTTSFLYRPAQTASLFGLSAHRTRQPVYHLPISLSRCQVGPSRQPPSLFSFPLPQSPRDGIVGAGRRAPMAAAPLHLHRGMPAAWPRHGCQGSPAVNPFAQNPSATL